MKYISHSAEEMKALGAELATQIQAGPEKGINLITLQGDFGTGKTTFTQGLAAGLGIEKQVVSPSYVYIREYDLPKAEGKLVHVDAWRIKRAEDLLLTGLEDYLVAGNVVVVEWGGELLADFLEKLSLPNLIIKRVTIEETAEGREVVIV